MTQALRQEVLEYGIRITNIQPGDVATRLASRSIDQEVKFSLLIILAYIVQFLR